MLIHEPRNLPDWIMASARRALPGQPPAPLRGYSFAFDEDTKRITLKAEVERGLTEAEREDLAVAQTEATQSAPSTTRPGLSATGIEIVVEAVPLRQPLHPSPGGAACPRKGERAVAA